MKRESIAKYLEIEIECFENEIEKFKTKFDRDACYALEWSDNAFEAAAKLPAYNAVRALLLDESVSNKDLVALVQEKMLQHARFPRHSTSPPSNLIHQFATAAWADMANRVALHDLSEAELPPRVEPVGFAPDRDPAAEGEEAARADVRRAAEHEIEPCAECGGTDMMMNVTPFEPDCTLHPEPWCQRCGDCPGCHAAVEALNSEVAAV